MKTTEVQTLLRRHHAKIRRMVRRYQRSYQASAHACVKIDGLNPECWDMRIDACYDILAALDRMVEKKP